MRSQTANNHYNITQQGILMCKRLALVISAISGLASLGAQADVPVAFHLSGQGVYTQVKASSEKLSPSLFQLKADVEFTRHGRGTHE
jgi:hypothetical protein